MAEAGLHPAERESARDWLWPLSSLRGATELEQGNSKGPFCEDGERGLHLTKWFVFFFLLLGVAAGITLGFLLEIERPGVEFTTKFHPERIRLAHRDFPLSWLWFTLRALNCWLCLKFLLSLGAYVSDSFPYDDIVCTLTQELFS